VGQPKVTEQGSGGQDVDVEHPHGSCKERNCYFLSHCLGFPQDSARGSGSEGLGGVGGRGWSLTFFLLARGLQSRPGAYSQ
jgi:hypothetical protein